MLGITNQISLVTSTRPLLTLIFSLDYPLFFFFFFFFFLRGVGLRSYFNLSPPQRGGDFEPKKKSFDSHLST